MDGLLSILLAPALAAAVTLLIVNRQKFFHTGQGGAADQLASALRDEQMKSSIIMNAIEDGVILIDRDGSIRSFNHGSSLITGWNEVDAMNLKFSAVIKLVNAKGEPYGDAANPFTRVFKEGTTIRDNTACLLNKDNKTIALSLSVSPLIDASRQVYAAVAVIRDVTKERAEETQRAEFISTASHEMRTPVAAIEGYLSLALNDRVSTIDTRARDFLEKAHTSTQHLGKLFQDLLTSAKAEDGRLSSHPVVVEVGSYLEQLTSDLKFAAEHKGLMMEFIIGTNNVIDASADSGRVIKPLYYTLVDPERMREVVTNLFDNAVKYTESGKISIGLTGNEQVVQFYIKDTGPGIPADDLPHLFQKFYRVDNSATRTIGGTGLGLFICRKIVELYRGRIWAESTVGDGISGTTFFINLPRLSAAQATQLQQAEAANQALPTITSLANPG
ncbi:MAG TPA: PAS domain-containing sensor histidine kinase [Candidatus Saccharimonadales bacterium]|nr:PAS domain-containing sensor histidine kinase [Candidatus Saccharimonadales bacterium]